MPATYTNASLEPWYSTKQQDPPATMQAGLFIYMYLFIHLYYIKKIYLSVGIISYLNDFVNPSFDYQRLSTIERLSRATMLRLSPDYHPTIVRLLQLIDYRLYLRLFRLCPATIKRLPACFLLRPRLPAHIRPATGRQEDVLLGTPSAPSGRGRAWRSAQNVQGGRDSYHFDGNRTAAARTATAICAPRFDFRAFCTSKVNGYAQAGNALKTQNKRQLQGGRVGA